jgi:hypothetical protein
METNFRAQRQKVNTIVLWFLLWGIGSCIFSCTNDEIPSQAEDDELCEKINSGDGGTISIHFTNIG